MTLPSELPGQIASATFSPPEQTGPAIVSHEKDKDPSPVHDTLGTHTVADALTSAGIPAPMASIVEPVIETNTPESGPGASTSDEDQELEQAKRKAAIEAIIKWIMEFLHLDSI